MLTTDVAEGIHRVEDAHTNWYLVEDGDALTVVDCGVPTSWSSFENALERLGRPRDAVRAIVLTHAHFDHIGSPSAGGRSCACRSSCTRTTCR